MIYLSALVACSSPPPTVVGLRPAPAARAQPPGCPVPGDPVVRGELANPQLDEVSGLVKSRKRDLYWVHNDSGDKARVYAVGPAGEDRGSFMLDGIKAEDWEDMALLAGAEGDFLLLGDIGDNDEERQSVQIHRIAEPELGGPGTVAAESMEVRYPDGPHNAEVLLVDPRDGRIYILTKSRDGRSMLFALGPWKPGEVVAKAVGERRFPKGRSAAKATGGDVSPDGSWVAIRTYATAWLFPVTGEFSAAFGVEPCEVAPPTEPQGESISFVDGGLVTVSEGVGEPLNFIPWSAPVAK